MGALPRKRGPALGRDGHVQAASPRPMLGSERLHRGTRAPRDGATTEPHGALSSRGQGLGVPGCGGTCHPCPRLAPHVGSPAQRAHGGPSRGGPTVHMAPGRPPLGLEAPAEQTPISGGPQATGNSHRAPLLPAPRRTRKPGVRRQGRAFRSPHACVLPARHLRPPIRPRGLCAEGRATSIPGPPGEAGWGGAWALCFVRFPQLLKQKAWGQLCPYLG